MVKNGTFASPAMARASSVLPVPGRADHQHALGNLAAELLELARVLEEVDDLADFLLGLVDAGDVGEGHVHLVLKIAGHGDHRRAGRIRARDDVGLGGAFTL